MDIGAWLAETYGQDLSGVTEIKEVPSDVTGALLFSRSKEKRLSFFLFFTDDAIEVVLAETITNLHPLTPLPILRLFRTAGTLDALASCKNLRVLDCSGDNFNPMQITGAHAIANLKH